MANKPATVTLVSTFTPFDGWKIAWGPMANGDIGVNAAGTSGTGMTMANYSDRSFQVEGTFGSSGTCVLEGTNDGTNWRTLSDPQGNAISLTTAAIKQITEACIQVRPHVTNGDGTTSLTVTMFFRTAIRP